MKPLNTKKSIRRKNTIKKISKGLLAILIMFSTFGTLTSCGNTKTAKGAGAGAIVGGLVGGWEGMATGALVGGGVGLMADSADDKKIRQDQKEREIAELKKSNAQTAKPIVKVNSNNVLTGTSWKAISMVDQNKESAEFSSFVLSFHTSSKATTLILKPDGSTETYTESYTLVGDALIFKGKDYVVNSEFKINGDQMVVVTPTHRVVLQEIKERA